MTTPASSNQSNYSRLLHGLAVALTLVVFPLIWVGGLVTTYDAGMAVPDWPNTYGYNMFAYPASTWLFGPFDLMVEHSHRLLGTLAGMISIGILVTAYLREKRRWFQWWALGVLIGVIAQGVLGGLRVVLDQRTFALIHGCTGPLFFAVATATAVMSSRWWLDQRSATANASRLTANIATVLLVASYCQLIIGAHLRHVTGAVSHGVFMGYVHLHLTFAGIALLLAIFLAMITRSRTTPARVKLPALLIFGLVLVQIALGIGTWIVNYALPWQETTESLARYTILAKGYWESMIVTAHMATGSLIISLATVISLRAWRSRANMVAQEVNWKWKQQPA
jgi:heme a synthase